MTTTMTMMKKTKMIVKCVSNTHSLQSIYNNEITSIPVMGNEAEEDYEDDDLENLCPKYLIFSTGSKTYTPHQIGFKRVRNINFPKKLEPGPSLKERIAAKERERVLQVRENTHWNSSRFNISAKFCFCSIEQWTTRRPRLA